MHVLTKIFIVLVSLLAVALVPLVAVNARNEASFKGQLEEARTKAAAAQSALAAGVVVVGALSDGRPVRKRDVDRGHLEDGTPLPAELRA